MRLHAVDAGPGAVPRPDGSTRRRSMAGASWPTRTAPASVSSACPSPEPRPTREPGLNGRARFPDCPCAGPPERLGPRDHGGAPLRRGAGEAGVRRRERAVAGPVLRFCLTTASHNRGNVPGGPWRIRSRASYRNSKVSGPRLREEISSCSEGREPAAARRIIHPRHQCQWLCCV